MSDDRQSLDDLGHRQVCGIAALSLLEALILVLIERNVITDDQLDDAFAAAIDAHRRKYDAQDETSEVDNRVAELLERLRVHGNSVRLS